MVNPQEKNRLVNTITVLLLIASICLVYGNCEDEYFDKAATALNNTLNFILSGNAFLNVDGMLGLNAAQVSLILVFGNVLLSFQNDEAEVLGRTTYALERIFDFVLNDAVHLNVDAILGINVAHAHLKKALAKTIEDSVAQTVTTLLDKAKLISDQQTVLLPNFPYKYYVFNNYVIASELWERDINFTYGKLNLNPTVYPGPYNVKTALGYADYITSGTFSEQQSDACYVEVATATDDTQLHECPVSDLCVGYMLTMPTNYSAIFPGYGVTHMALFLQIARNRNCNFDYSKVDALLEETCSYILWELRTNVQFGYISNLDDLFIEQIDICGFEGFGEFLQKDYLEYILKAQFPNGGYGTKLMTRRQLLNRNRPKRESVQMADGANSHTTGLAASVLSLFIRVLIEKPFSNKAFYEDQ